MKVSVKVKPNSKKPGLIANPDLTLGFLWIAQVKAPPVDGKANKEVIELLARHYKVPKKSISLLTGGKSRIKTFQVDL